MNIELVDESASRTTAGGRRSGPWLMRLVACVWSMIATGALSHAQGSTSGPEVPSSQVALPDTIKLSRLVDVAGELTGQPYAYVQAELDVLVTLRLPGGLKHDQVPSLLSHILTSRGFTTVRTPGSPLLTVVRLDQAAGLARVATPESPHTPGPDAGRGSAAGDGAFVTELYTPKHVSAKTLADAVRSVLSKPGGSVSVLGETNHLIMSDLASRLENVRAILEVLDSADTTSIRSVPLRFLTGTQAVPTLMQLATKRDVAGGRRPAGEVLATPDGSSLLLICQPEAVPRWLELVAAVDQREPVDTRTYTPRYFAPKDVARLIESTVQGGGAISPDDRFRVVSDELTGGLIITATQLQHERIEDVLARLDQAERPITPVRSFPVRNRPVAELAAVLNGLIAAGVLEAGVAAPRADVSAGASQSNPRPPFATPGGETQGGANPSAASGAARQTVAGSGRSTFSLTADPATNSLIAMGEPRLLSQLESLLTTLDVRQPQVMLEAVLISLSETEALDLGVELERLQSIGDTTLKLTSLFGLSAGGPLTGATPAGAGFTGVVLSPGEYGAVLRALQSINKARSLSNPRLLVTNNEQAVFSSVLQQPITQQTRTGTNDQVFSYGGNESAGTTISVRPQIAQGDHLVLTYSIKLSNFVGASSTAGLPPPKQENAVDSIATIPDGHTVVVGGLEISTETEGESRVPLIGSVPVLGELFKKRTDGSGRSRFYVFIRASVLRSESFGDLKHMSALSSQAMGAPDGWPAVEPRVIR